MLVCFRILVWLIVCLLFFALVYGLLLIIGCVAGVFCCLRSMLCGGLLCCVM